jgi:hypothetical protein
LPAAVEVPTAASIVNGIKPPVGIGCGVDHVTRLPDMTPPELDATGSIPAGNVACSELKTIDGPRLNIVIS